MATAEQEQIGEFLLDEKTLREIEAMKGAGQWSIVWRRIKKDKMGMLGLYIVLFLILMAFASWILLGFDNWLTELGVLYGDPEKIGSINNLYIELWLPGMPKDSPLVLFQHPRHHFAAEARLPPSFLHPFGTDGIGHDMLSRVFFGATVSLALGFIGQMTTVIIGTVLGSIAGFYGGVIDDVLQRVIEILYSMPGFILMIFIIVLFDRLGRNSTYS